MRLLKRLGVLLVIGLVIVIAWTPWWTTRMAERAFENYGSPQSPRIVRRAIKIKTWLLTFGQAQAVAEKAIIYFPESNEADEFLLSAARCAERASRPKAAIYWYQRFLKRFPNHKEADPVQNELKRLAEMYQ